MRRCGPSGGLREEKPRPRPVHVDQKPGKVKEDTPPTDVIVISDDEDDDTEETEDGRELRKSPRERTKPLWWWRGETKKREGKEGTTAVVEKGFNVGTVKSLRELLTPNTALNAPKGYAWVTEADHDLIVKEWEERERVKKIPNMPPPNFTTPNNHWKPWTRDDDDKLMHALWRHRRERKLSATEFWQMMAKTLDRGWQAVQWRCNAFQLRGDWSPSEAKAGDQDPPREAQHRASPSPSHGRKTDWTKEEDAQLVRLRRNTTGSKETAPSGQRSPRSSSTRARASSAASAGTTTSAPTSSEDLGRRQRNDSSSPRTSCSVTGGPTSQRTSQAAPRTRSRTTGTSPAAGATYPCDKTGPPWCYASTSCGKVDPGSVASTAASRTRRSGAWDPRDQRLCATPAA